MLLRLTICETLIGLSWGIVLSIYAPSLVASGINYAMATILATVATLVASILAGIFLRRINMMPLASLTLILSLLSDAKYLPTLVGLAAGIHGVNLIYVSSKRDFKGYSLAYSSGLFGLSFGALLLFVGIPKEIAIITALSGLFYPRVVSMKENSGEKVRIMDKVVLFRRCDRTFSSEHGLLFCNDL